MHKYWICAQEYVCKVLKCAESMQMHTKMCKMFKKFEYAQKMCRQKFKVAQTLKLCKQTECTEFQKTIFSPKHTAHSRSSESILSLITS